MIHLPKNLSALALAAASDGTRYSMTGIQVEEYKDGQFTATATDGKILCVIRGHGFESFPHPQMFDLNNDQFTYCIPAKALQKALNALKPDRKNPWPALGVVAETGPIVNGAASTGKVMLCDGVTSQVLDQIEGRFPDFRQVVPGKPALLTLTLDPALMIRLLTVAESFLRDSNTKSVHLLFWGDGMPAGITARSDRGEFFDGLIVPLTGKGGESHPTRPDEKEEDEDEPAPSLKEQREAEATAEEMPEPDHIAPPEPSANGVHLNGAMPSPNGKGRGRRTRRK